MQGVSWSELWCPEWGSNPHLEDFKSSASAIGLSGPTAGAVYLPIPAAINARFTS